MNKKNIVFINDSGTVYSFRYEDLLGIKGLGSGVVFCFDSDKHNEIIQIIISVTDHFSFVRDFQDQVNFSKQDFIIVLDSVKDYSFSNYVEKDQNVAFLSIASPTILNGDLNLSIDEDGNLLSAPYNVTAGDVTAVSNLISNNNVTFEGSLIDNSSPDPTAVTDGAGETVSISGKDSAGVVEFTTAGASGSNVTVTYGTASTHTRIPVVSMLGGVDAYLVSYDQTSFTVRVGTTGVVINSKFTYITQDHS